MGADYSFEVKNIEIWVPAFFKHNNSSVATVPCNRSINIYPTMKKCNDYSFFQIHRRLDGHLGPKLTNMSADLLDVFGRNSSDKICSDTPPSILSPSICVNPVIMETSKVTEDDFDLVYYNDANKGSSLPHVKFETCPLKTFALVTQPMLQRRPNQTEWWIFIVKFYVDS